MIRSVADAIRGATFRFVADLRTLGFWLVACGVIVVTLGSAVAPQGAPITLRSLGARSKPGRPLASLDPDRSGDSGVGVHRRCAALIFLREAIVPMAVALVGAYLGYLGLFQILKVVAPQDASRSAPSRASRRSNESSNARCSNRGRALAGLTIAFLFVADRRLRRPDAQGAARRVAAAEIECNGATELCDGPRPGGLSRVSQLDVGCERARMALRREPHRHTRISWSTAFGRSW